MTAMQITTTRELGAYGERLATRYLTDHGFVVVDRNWRCVRGEIDIVAVEGRALVVCEVKTRSSETFGMPFEAVGRQKLRRLRLLAGLWVEHRAGQVSWPGSPRSIGDLRIDVVSILRGAAGPITVAHLRGVE